MPPLLPGQPPLAILVDYDGTIALTDVGDTIMVEFVPPAIWDELEAAYEQGRMGSREIMTREMELLPPDPDRGHGDRGRAAARPGVSRGSSGGRTRPASRSRSSATASGSSSSPAMRRLGRSGPA